jgi:hypothetical protein
MSFLDNKRGQGMSTSTIILLILGVVVLVVLILGFTMGWQKIAPFLSKTNVDDVVTSCQAACTLGSTYDFCSAPRELRDAEKNEFKSTCEVYSNLPEFRKYGVTPCQIDCNLECNQIVMGENVGFISSSANNLDVYDVTFIVSNVPSGQFCFVQK